MLQSLRARLSALADAVRAHLVDDWHEALSWWSVRWAAIGTVVLPALQVLPPELPYSVQAMFPPALRAAIAGLWCVGFFAFRLWGQNR